MALVIDGRRNRVLQEQNMANVGTFNCTKCNTLMYKPAQGGVFACPGCQTQFKLDKLPDK